MHDENGSPHRGILSSFEDYFQDVLSLSGNQKAVNYTISSTCIFMKNEIKVTWFQEDTSPLRSNLKGEVVKDIDRDKKPQGTKKIIKTSCTRANFY